MPDITMCKGGRCPRQENCYRKLAQPDDKWQAYFSNPPWDPETDTCDYYEPME